MTAVGHLSHARPFASRFRAVAGGIAAWLAGAAACVDTGPRTGTPPTVTKPTCEVAAPVPYSGDAVIPSQDPAAPPACPVGMTCPYAWKNVTIKGGGFVSGIITSPALAGLMFARTDVGGAYRFDPSHRRWMAITDWLGRDDGNLTGIESIAADPVDPNRVYLAAGTYLTGGNGAILRSTDMGQTWARSNISVPMGGNADGRSMGERLAIDPNLPSTLFFGSRNAGLWKSDDAAVTWTKVNSFPTTGATNNDGVVGYGLTLVLFDPRSGSPGGATPTIYVGVGLVGMGANPDTALYRSTDAGASWQPVPGQPTGMMPHHAALDGCGNVYFTYNDGSGPNGPKPANTTGSYSSVNRGAVWRLDTTSDTWIDVSPPRGAGGFGGISADAAHPGTLIATTLDRWSPDEIYRTTDGGGTWVAIGSGAGRDVAGAVWLSFHSSNLSATGWMGDVEIDPFNPARALYVTGQGVWSSDDVTAADTTGGQIHWTFDDAGLEETVTLDLASPPDGAPLLSGVGDIAGFRHDDLTMSPPDGMFANPVFGNTSSLDFAEGAANVVVRVGTNSVPARTGAYSLNGGTTWTQFPTLPAGTTGQGSIAVSSDGATFVWATARGGTPSYSRDRGLTWTASMGLVAGARVAADRVNPAKFYATNRNTFYVSSDGGAIFRQTTTVTGALRPRPVFGVEGDLWVPVNNNGLLHSQDSGASFTAATVVSSAAAVGFGMPAPGATYPAVYLAGAVSGVWGVYRSDDAGASWARIDDPQHQFGVINNVAGDPRIYGRVYLGTGGRGIVYGDPR